MKKISLFIFLVIGQFAYSQEEFFGDNTGMSISMLHGVSDQSITATGGGIGVHFKNGVTSSIGVATSNSIVSLGYLVNADSETNPNPIRPYIGISYALFNAGSIWAANFDLIKCFNIHSNFPFSIDGSASPQMISSNDNNSSNSLFDTSKMFEMNTVFGLGYKHALFAKNAVYPIIGLNYTFDINGNKFYSVAIAVNFNL